MQLLGLGWSGIAGDTDQGRDQQDNRGQNHGDANVVSHGPFRRHAIQICRRGREWSAKQDAVPGDNEKRR